MKFSKEQYEELKEHLNSIETPTNKLAIIRQEAYETFVKKKKRKKIIIVQFVAVATILALFCISVRISPAFANTVSKIPGFSPIVKLITEDKGLKDIVNNEYYEQFDKKVTKNGVTFTLVGAIADEYGIFLPYTIETTKNSENVEFSSVKIKQNGKELENGSLSYGWSPKENSKLVEEVIQFQSVEKIDYTNRNFELEITYDSPINETITIPFTLTKPILETKTYDLNKDIVIDNQTIHLQDLKITPLHVGLTLELDPNNTMQILNINKIKLIDEKGEKWGTIKNGVIAFGDFREEGKKTLFFKSNYFRNPKRLTLTIDEIEALPKGEDYIEIDFSKKQVLKNPLSNDVKVKIVDNHSVEIQYEKGDDKSHSPILSNALDQDGTVYYPNEVHSRVNEPIIETFVYDFKNAKNPIKLFVNKFPNYLKGSAKVEIPIK